MKNKIEQLQSALNSEKDSHEFTKLFDEAGWELLRREKAKNKVCKRQIRKLREILKNLLDAIDGLNFSFDRAQDEWQLLDLYKTIKRTKKFLKK